MVKQKSEEEIYEEAKTIVEAKRKFYRDLVAYVIISTLLVFIWAFPAGRGYPWFWFPIGGWGIFIILDYFKVFVFSKGGYRAAIEKEVEKIKGGRG
ncbi:2TM domain-containing protein [Chloroflexota bacterium]